MNLHQLMLKHDGVLAIVRKYEDQFYLITSTGYMGRLSSPDAVNMLTMESWVGLCTWRQEGRVAFWYLKPDPLITGQQQAWVDKLNGATGDCIIARLLAESE